MHIVEMWFDLRSAEELDLKPLERRLIATGLTIAIPDGYAGLFNRGVVLHIVRVFQ